MKNPRLKKSLALFLFSAVLIAVPVSANDAGSGMYGWWNAFWGDQQQRDAVATCDLDVLSHDVNHNNLTYVPTGGIGFVNVVNYIFCQLEKNLGIKSATDSLGATGSFQYGSTVTIHAVVVGSTGGNAQSDGTNPDTYDYRADIWGCRDNLDCTQTANFNKLMRVFWTKSSNRKVNKGKYYFDQSVLNGMTGAVLGSNVWDQGSDTTTKYTEIKMRYSSAYAWIPINYYGYNEVTGDVIKTAFFQTFPGSTDTTNYEARFAAIINKSTNLVRTKLNYVQIQRKRPTG